MKKLGTFTGVFIPSFEAILGAVLFLLLPQLVGAVGFRSMIMVVLLANSATLATAFSISDTATNLRQMGSGGMYALSKRSLGLAFGGSIGIQLFIAQAVSIGFYCIGFAEPLNEILSRWTFFAELDWAPLRKQQVVATVVALLAFTTVLIGTNLVSRLQLAIFVVLSLAVVIIFLSPTLSPTNGGTPIFGDRLYNGIPTLGFWAAFTIFFPAVTGIDAGIGMSGLLRQPRRSLPSGTFLAIGASMLIYLLATLLFAFIRVDLLQPQNGVVPSTIFIFQQTPLISVILLIGVLVATSSSTLSYLVTAPRTLQALTSDRVLPPFLRFLQYDMRPGGSEPRWAALLTLLIALAIIWSGDLTYAATIVGISFLMVYGWINLAACFERLSGNPSFRPTSRGHWLISLYGFVICVIGIVLFNPVLGLGIIICQLLIFSLILHFRAGNKLEGVWWGLYFSLIGWVLARMRKIIQGARNWRPIVGAFIFPDNQLAAQDTLRVVKRIGKYKGLIMVTELEGSGSDAVIRMTSRALLPGHLSINTVVLPFDERIDLVTTIETLANEQKNVLLYHHGPQHTETPNRIDVWWKGKQNGNLMALLAYIISESDVTAGQARKSIRLLRKLSPDDEPAAAEQALQRLIIGARLGGHVEIVPADDRPLYETIGQKSSDAALIIMGIPGQQTSGLAKVLAIDNWLFVRQFAHYENFPPMLFVRAAAEVDLLE